MRVWGRITNADGSRTWVEVSTGPDGLNQEVFITWLAQVLQLNLGESPFWADWGIPQYQTIMTQLFPTYYVMETQMRFQGMFAGLQVVPVAGTVDPTYNVNVLTKAGATINLQVAT